MLLVEIEVLLVVDVVVEELVEVVVAVCPISVETGYLTVGGCVAIVGSLNAVMSNPPARSMSSSRINDQ